MKKLWVLLGPLLWLFCFAGVAHAILFNLDTYGVDLSAEDPGLVLNWSPVLPAPCAFELEVSNPLTVDLFKMWTEETYANGDDEVPKSIGVNFAFSGPPPSFGGTVEGESWGVSGKFWFLQYQFGKVLWDGPKTLYFGPESDGELEITLSDATFNWGLYGLWGKECFGATIQATFLLKKEPSPVPEPATLLLLGPGLIGLAGWVRRAGK